MSKEEKLQKVTEKQALDTIAKQEEKEAAKEKETQKTEKVEKHDHKHVEKKEEKQAEKPAKREIVLDRMYTVSLLKAYRKPAPKRANTAVKMLRSYVARHAKAKEENVKISPKVQQFIHARGHTKPAKSVKVKVTVDKQGIAQVELK